jgi:hypothetical protein
MKVKDTHLPCGSASSGFPEAMVPGIAMLLSAWRFAQQLRVDVWTYAVEIEGLSMAGLTATDLRWLECNGYIDHAIETTRAHQDNRTFRKNGRMMFPAKTAVVLTAAGAEAAARLLHRSPETNGRRRRHPRFVPHWDKARRSLSLGGRLIKQIKQPAPDQEAIIAAFEEEGWPPRIDDPLTGRAGRDPTHHLEQTINNLNRHQKNARIKFRGDGTGQGVRWEIHF